MARIKCPRITCRSKHCVPVTQDKKYKKGKGLVGSVVGGVVLGVPGALVGAATGFNGKSKVKFVCQDCGKIFEVKM